MALSTRPPTVPDLERLRDATKAVLDTLSTVEAKVLRLRFGIETTAEAVEDIAKLLDIPAEVVASIEHAALRKLRHPSRSTALRSLVENEAPAFEEPSPIEVRSVIEEVTSLTPDLISHLRLNSSDIEKVPWVVFEHLVAELLASVGFEDVSLVGKNSATSADIFAAWKIGALGTKVRYFVEVKRWKDRVGVEVIDRVYGAMLAERPRIGWHAALIVSIQGFQEFRKYRCDELAKLGIELKDKNDLFRWLQDYEPNSGGLWLPRPRRDVPTAI